ncbi:MAG: NTP transferase domain-containing protein [Bacteroidetes bacterium]|nr:NTP transferase domain-containing protein [Bacteroidota bacterium]
MNKNKEHNVAILITARLKSTRLPMKAIKPIAGRPMLSHMIDRLKLASIPEKIIICTSTVAQDNPLEEIAIEENVFCYRGHPDDVLARMTAASDKFKVDTIISCTADNPFVDSNYIDKLAGFHIKEGNDFSRIDGLPLGAFSYALSFPAMMRACEIKDELDTEVWGGYFTETGLFKCGALEVSEKKLKRPEIRLTVDEPDDFELIDQIFTKLYKPGKVFSLEEIIKLYDNDLRLQKLNSHIRQKPGIPIKTNF